MSSTLKTGLLLGALTALMILLGGAIGGQGGVVIAFVLAILTNVFSYWFSDKLVLRMYRAQEVGPEHPLTRVVARLAQKAGLPMPKCYVIPDMSPNAFATGRSPEHSAVAATEGILRLLPENELEGVIAHELSHVKHRDILISTVAATLAAAIMFLAQMARFGAYFAGTGSSDDRRGGNPIAMLAMALLAPLAAMLIQMAVSRQREYAADRGGATLVGSPTGLASALRRIDAAAKQIPMEDATPATAHLFIMNPFTRQGLMSLFQTHPPTEERIKALMAMRPGQ
ncbi:MAG TPA: zinc metalloprotease HtpX [Vicinamibacterales bacterium]|nr:zinc metalloprotease HtpX [Vicinamibacterales bacterium]